MWTFDLYAKLAGRNPLTDTACKQRAGARIWLMNRTPNCPYCGIVFWHPDMTAHDHIDGDGAADRGKGTRPNDEAGAIWASFNSKRAYCTEEQAYATYTSKYQLICANCNSVKKTQSADEMRGIIARVREVFGR